MTFPSCIRFRYFCIVLSTEKFSTYSVQTTLSSLLHLDIYVAVFVVLVCIQRNLLYCQYSNPVMPFWTDELSPHIACLCPILLSLLVSVKICSKVLKKLLTSGATLDVHCSYPAPPTYLYGYQSAHHTGDNDDYIHAGPVRVSPLIQAILLGNFEMTQELIRQGASVNFPDSNGRSPLMAAISVVNQCRIVHFYIFQMSMYTCSVSDLPLLVMH